MKRQSDEKMLSLADVCRELSISEATAKNWIKLGKLIPDKLGTTYFSIDYMQKLKADISSGNNTALKSRRNKKFVSGRGLYYSYIPNDSKNLAPVQEIVNFVDENNIEITNDLLLSIIADCALKLILSMSDSSINIPVLKAFINNEYLPEPYSFLINDLIDGIEGVSDIIDEYPELFTKDYYYEKDVDVIGLLYISLKSSRERKVQGCYYTPSKVAKRLCHNLTLSDKMDDKKIFDPCCGTGNFILQFPDSFDYNNVYANDIDPLSVKLARINYAFRYRLSDKQLIYSHITESDYLYFPKNKKFDYILGNPPWGYHYSHDEKIKLHDKFNCATTLSIESYDIFIEQALSNLKMNGTLSFILPHAILNVKSHTPIRKIIFEKCSFDYIEFLSKAFDSVNCPSIILQMKYTGLPFSALGMRINEGHREYTIDIERKMNAEYCSFNTTDDEYMIIQKIEATLGHTTLAGQSTFALGIITGDNKRFLSDTKSDKNEQILSGNNVFKYKSKNPSKYIEFKPELYQQVAPTEHYRVKEKLIYRFICNQIVMAYDNKSTLTLNSCNVLIPQIPGLYTKYVMGILNSRVVQFYFRKMFDSVKVLRSHIEKIPIPVVGVEEQNKIIEIVDKILRLGIKVDTFRTIKLYNELDLRVAKLYNITDKEYDIILKSMDKENLFLP
ncbi:MAG: TaqI-like C-terminal specificity domain-containing protein [Catonella sp.]|uniref:TaqI-like C-terminal specificity domain-containing protein n=1 Tax=Catonella sp. TaxID=2382125 RepID=UPI003FA0CE0A